MSLADLRAELATEVLVELGETASYQLVTGGDPLTLQVRHYRQVELYGDDGTLSVFEHVVGISVADIAKPVKGDQVTLDGRTYKVGRLIDQRGDIRRYEMH